VQVKRRVKDKFAGFAASSMAVVEQPSKISVCGAFRNALTAGKLPNR
jgi:hypothetical protein